MSQPRLLIFASGTAHTGGSGFESLVQASRSGELQADIVGVVSNHGQGGVYQRAQRLNIPFVHANGPIDALLYQELANKFEADYFALSGWLKQVSGLDLHTRFNARTVFNIHPGPLPDFGGKGMYGSYVHEAVLSAVKRGERKNTEICLHFVTEQYDEGPVFFRQPVEVNPLDTVETLAARVHASELVVQPIVTNLVVTGQIRWDGLTLDSLIIP